MGICISLWLLFAFSWCLVIWALFHMYLLDVWIPSFGKCVEADIFKNWIFGLFLLVSSGCLCILWFAFSPLWHLWWTEVFNLNESTISIFYFAFSAYCAWIQKSFSTPRPWKDPSVTFSRSFVFIVHT